MPWRSNVNRTSIVADGASVSTLLPAFFADSFRGLKAEESTLAMASVGQLAVMLSGNRESSNTRISDSERRPSMAAEA